MRDLAQLAQHVESVQTGEHHVEDDRVEPFAKRPLETVGSRVGSYDFVSHWPEVVAHQTTKLDIVVDDQKARLSYRLEQS